MIHSYVNDAGRLLAVDSALGLRDDVVWLDLDNPTREEEAEVERLLGIDVPTRDDMEEIEISSRLYYDNGTAFMTAMLPSQADGDDPILAPVSFVLMPARLVTVRYHEPRAFQAFPQRAARVVTGCETAEGVLLALLEVTVDRLADILERAGRDIDAISKGVFQHESGQPALSKGLQAVLAAIGRKGDLTSKIRDSLVTLERLIGFFSHGSMERRSSKDVRERIKTLSRDLRSLTDHASFLASKTTFLLDATLGLINIEQNAIIKIFSVAAAVFLPPTLIASIYGMNFARIPELGWPFGYPLALALMVVSAVLPYFFFKRRGWL